MASALGHLFTLHSKRKGLPVYDPTWTPIWLVERSRGKARKHYELIEKLARDSDKVINACDYDDEGSLIGFIILKMTGSLSKAYRMKFSTLTKQEIVKSYLNLTPIDVENVEAAWTRHELDWLWGINISRLLMKILRREKTPLSAGRVQSPTLKHVIDAYIRRETHIATPHYKVEAVLSIGSYEIRASHTASPFNSRTEAYRTARRLRKVGVGHVERVERRSSSIPPPRPFDLHDLQSEAARRLGFTPQKTLMIAERLYLKGLISYPRTRSQRLPPDIDNRYILGKLGELGYIREVGTILSENPGLKTRRGGRGDPAHPAIYPTGNHADKLTAAERDLLDLIVKRYIAFFSSPALKEDIMLTIFISKDKLKARTNRIVKPGWMKIYYKDVHNGITIEAEKGDRVKVERVRTTLFHPAHVSVLDSTSIIKWMEKNRIGTPATRTYTITLLQKRGYVAVQKGRITPTPLGFIVIKYLEDKTRQIVMVEMTRRFEKMIEEVRRGSKKRGEVIEQAVREIERTIEASMKAGKQLSSHPARCRICGLPAEKQGLCRLHYRALKNLMHALPKWRRVLEEKDDRKILRTIARTRSVGSEVREIATQIYLKGEKWYP